MAWFFVGMVAARVLISVLFVLVSIRIVIGLVNRGRERHREWHSKRAEETLKRRFAEGKVDIGEYRDRLAVLREADPIS